jgi:hypothetical protein
MGGSIPSRFLFRVLGKKHLLPVSSTHGLSFKGSAGLVPNYFSVGFPCRFSKTVDILLGANLERKSAAPRPRLPVIKKCKSPASDLKSLPDFC